MSKIKMLTLMIGLFCLPMILFAQSGRKQVLEGNKLFIEEKYDEANNKYRDALIDNPENPIIHFNIGSAQYKKNKYEEAMKDYEKSLSIDDVLTQSKSYYNMGNTLYRMGKLPESILAYTQALKLNPNDEDAKYNLEFVRAKLKDQPKDKQQQKQQQQQEQQQQEQQQQEQQQQGDDQKQEKEEQEKQQDQSEEQQEKEQEQQQQQQQEQPQEMSKEEAERILEALKEDDKDLQKQKKTKKAGSVRVVKDW